ncbi:MAG: mechanosensitive ion channel family protein, partial [Gammaproteobacteria bacterium]|nr:mechanosensitive ion channel family protein [Gammaproteobacteria bacterium]
VTMAAIYAWTTFVLQQFPYSRPWGEALGNTLLQTLGWAARGAVDAIPGLLAVAVIMLLTRLLTRLARAFF